MGKQTYWRLNTRIMEKYPEKGWSNALISMVRNGHRTNPEILEAIKAEQKLMDIEHREKLSAEKRAKKAKQRHAK